MTITNKHDFPQAILKAVESHNYTGDASDITASKLGQPPRLVALSKIHRHELSSDVSEMLPIILGQAIHSILENHAPEGHLIEERLHTEVLGWSLSGQPDSLELRDGALIDWKTTRVDAFQIKARESFREWTEQMNTYRLILKDNGILVSSLAISAFLVDWSPSVALRQKDYPAHAMPQVPIEMWPLERTEAWIHERVRLHQAAMESLPLCSDSDRWKSDKWAVMVKGKKRALRVFDSLHEAEAFSQENPGSYVEIRAGQARRCQLYCPVSKFCTQWASDPDNHQEDLETLYGDSND